uniref:Coiled-coil and C2 domain-containing protein 1B n=1 Tax=Electrophorus electricus TaxID=8005 RepID=A0A4W4FRA5_ELEEL
MLKPIVAPLPMEDIEKMTEACMKDIDDDDDDDDNLEDDDDLLVSHLLHSFGFNACNDHAILLRPQESKLTSIPGSIEHTLEEKITMYRTAITNAKASGESSKARRYERGLKTLQGMLASTRKGGKINEAEIPPPVACGPPGVPARAPPVTLMPELESPEEHGESDSAVDVSPMSGEMSLVSMEAKFLPYQLHAHPPPGLPVGQEAPASQSTPGQPKTVLEALEQRMVKYNEASAQAKASGDERKARMHDRIAKQYQSAIRAHKAGRAVNYDDLPTPPGFPPIPGQAAAAPEQGFAAVLEAANKLASNEADGGEEDEDDGDEKQAKEVCPFINSFRWLSRPKRILQLFPTATDQLEVLEVRKKQYMKAALQAKQKNDLEQARLFLRTAKSLDPLIEAARSGKAMDMSKAPSPPGDEDEDFILVHHSDLQTSEKAEEVYSQLTNILKEQYEKCMTLSKQFTHMGNVAETTKFENMAAKCKKSLEIVKLAQNRGLDPPRHHFEWRTYHTVRIFPELSSTDMVVIIVRGMNLPAPQGVASNDLDAYVKFDFPYPSSDQPQRHKTSVIKNTNSPEYSQSFTLNINRNHRGFRRVVQSKGLKLEVFHKGGFLRSDKPVGTAHIKLEKLECESEVREIAEIMDGRKPTGGRLEVRVRLREPLSGQDLSTVTERWLVLDQSQVNIL